MIYEELIISDNSPCKKNCKTCYLGFNAFKGLKKQSYNSLKKNIITVLTKYEFSENARVTFYYQIGKDEYNYNMFKISLFIKKHYPDFITEIVVDETIIKKYDESYSLDNFDEITMSMRNILKLHDEPIEERYINLIDNIILTIKEIDDLTEMDWNEITRFEKRKVNVFINIEKPITLSDDLDKYIDWETKINSSNQQDTYDIKSVYKKDICFYKQIFYAMLNPNKEIYLAKEMKSLSTISIRYKDIFILFDSLSIATSGFGGVLTYIPDGDQYYLSDCPYNFDRNKKNELTLNKCSTCISNTSNG